MLPDTDRASVAVTVKLDLPGVDGVPQSRPAGESVSPSGRLPELTLKV